MIDTEFVEQVAAALKDKLPNCNLIIFTKNNFEAETIQNELFKKQVLDLHAWAELSHNNGGNIYAIAACVSKTALTFISKFLTENKIEFFYKT